MRRIDYGVRCFWYPPSYLVPLGGMSLGKRRRRVEQLGTGVYRVGGINGMFCFCFFFWLGFWKKMHDLFQKEGTGTADTTVAVIWRWWRNIGTSQLCHTQWAHAMLWMLLGHVNREDRAVLTWTYRKTFACHWKANLGVAIASHAVVSQEVTSFVNWNISHG